MKTVDGLVVAITGASSGIGLACAEALRARGARVVLCARRGDRLRAAAAALDATGDHVEVCEGDVVREADMDALVALAVERFGRLDVMIANAGIGFHDSIEMTPAEVSRQLVDINLLGTIHAARAATRQFQQQNAGHLIVISSIVGRRGIGGSAVYSATKAAQVGLVEGIRAEWLGTPLKASLVYPISTATEFHDAIRRNFGQKVHGSGPRQSAASVAQAVVACIERPRAEVYPYRRAKLLAVFNVIAPGTLDWFVQRFRRTSRQADQP